MCALGSAERVGGRLLSSEEEKKVWKHFEGKERCGRWVEWTETKGNKLLLQLQGALTGWACPCSEATGSKSGYRQPGLPAVLNRGLGFGVLLDKQERNLENLLDSVKCFH